MTRKDYQLLAANLRESFDFLESLGTGVEDRGVVVVNLAQALLADNDAFDPVKFWDACGVAGS